MNSTYTQWYNDNESRQYPLLDGVSATNDAGSTLPTDIIADLSIAVPEAISTSIWVSSVRITDMLVTIGISSATGGILVGTYLRSSTVPYRAYPLVPLVDDVTGWVVFGNHLVSQSAVENYRFDRPAQSLVEHRCIRVLDPLPVTDMVKSGAYTTTPLTGLIRVEGGSGIIVEAGTDGHTIILRLDPRLASTLSGPCNASATADSCGVPPIRRINGVPSDSQGNIKLVFA